MKPDSFDALVRRHIQEEAFEIHPDFEKRLARRLADPQAVKSARRVSVRSLALAMALLMLLGGAALAASGWGSRLFLTREDKEGNPIVNEALVSLVQPIGQVFEGDAVRMELVDAIYDGQFFVMTWALQNKLSEDALYLRMENIRQDDVRISALATSPQPRNGLIMPGETFEGGLSIIVEPNKKTDILDFSFDYAVLTPQGEVVPMNYPYELEGEAFEAAYWAEVARIEAEGNVALTPDGKLALSPLALPENLAEVVPYSQMLVNAGRMAAVETIPVHLSLAPSAMVHSLLPDGQPVEKDNGDYILRITQADSSPGAIHFTLEHEFKNLKAMEKYAAYYGFPEGANPSGVRLDWWYHFENADDTLTYSYHGMPDNNPKLEANGKWVWRYQVTLTGLQIDPDNITIIPLRDEAANPGEFIPHPEEGITLTK
ncbi:MAG: hypothetical protein LBM74_03355 [Oscillospiraceae bacterium]|nr:hypothetical protein [Oscillospiraceae bacterium]